jgi:predicted metal-dependent HD superfamily phosphohydrolase
MDEAEIQRARQEAERHPIVQAALAILARELPPHLKYHTLAHTEDVLREAMVFGVVDHLPDRQLELLAVAAACHDAGFITSSGVNEPLGAAFAREQMARHGGYSPDEIELVERMILDTALVDTPEGPRQVPSTELSRYLLDADLSNFGRDDFFERGELQRQELGQERELFRKNTLALIKAHSWLTPAAKALRESTKARNVAVLESLVHQQKT